jgi:hypothetical protein
MKRNILGVLLLLVAAPAVAMTTSTPAPSAGKMNMEAMSSSPAVAKAMADDSSGMRKGTVQAVSQGASTFHVHGQQLTFDAQRVKVFGKDGKRASVYQLRTGANVRFTMDPTDPLKRRVAVIYLD